MKTAIVIITPSIGEGKNEQEIGHMRTLKPGRTQVNILLTRKREHSRKPDELYEIIEKCSPGPYLELFARCQRPGWDQWGNEVGEWGRKGIPCLSGRRSRYQETADFTGEAPI